MLKVLNQLDRFNDEKVETGHVCGVKTKEDKKENKELVFASFSNLKLIIKTFYENGILKEGEFDIFDLDLINKINDFFVSLVPGQNDKAKLRSLIQNNPYFDLSADTEANKKIIEELMAGLSGFAKTSGLSYKAMNDFLKNAFASDSAMNLMQYLQTIQMDTQNENSLNNTKYFPKNLFKDEIIPTTTKRAFNETFNVINKILKIYGKDYDIQNIVIELARESNTAEERKAIKKRQDKNKEQKDKIIADYDIPPQRLFGENLEKALLWEEQDKKDIYTGEAIDLDTLLKNPFAYNIDHIIPYSISLNNSKSNKVLTSCNNNQEKGNLTPYQWLSKKGLFKEFKQRVEGLYANKKGFANKLDNLLTMVDPNDQQIDFLERNLVDTRYASRLVLNSLTSFFTKNPHWKYETESGFEKYPLVKVINGGLTNYARYNLFADENHRTEKALMKNRDIYNHHAVDASIIAFLGSSYSIQKRLKYISNYDKYEQRKNDEGQNEFVDSETGEILNMAKLKLQNSNDVNKFKQQLIEILNHDNFDLNKEELIDPRNRKIGFSRLKSTKTNGQISNETVYSLRPSADEPSKGDIISRLDLLPADIKKANIGKYFDKTKVTKEQESLLCYKTDKRLFNQLQTIFYNYQSDPKVNPFVTYLNEFNQEHKTNYKDCVPVEVNGHIRMVRYLKYVNREVEIDNVLTLDKATNYNQEKMAMVDTLSAFGARIYRNKKGKLVGFNINIKVLKFDHKKKQFIIDQYKLNQKLDKLNIDRDAKYFELYKNQCFVDDEGVIWYSIGSVNNSSNRVEMKCLYCDNKLTSKGKRPSVVYNNLINKYRLLEIDELGNIRNVIKIDI